MIHINFTLSYIELALLLINILAFILYAYDKLQALKVSRNTSRVPEMRLLLLTLLGGSIGALFAMLLFRHKIKKASFMIKYFLIVILQISMFFLFYFDKITLIN